MLCPCRQGNPQIICWYWSVFTWPTLLFMLILDGLHLTLEVSFIFFLSRSHFSNSLLKGLPFKFAEALQFTITLKANLTCQRLSGSKQFPLKDWNMLQLPANIKCCWWKVSCQPNTAPSLINLFSSLEALECLLYSWSYEGFFFVISLTSPSLISFIDHLIIFLTNIFFSFNGLAIFCCVLEHFPLLEVGFVFPIKTVKKASMVNCLLYSSCHVMKQLTCKLIAFVVVPGLLFFPNNLSIISCIGRATRCVFLVLPELEVWKSLSITGFVEYSTYYFTAGTQKVTSSSKGEMVL